MKKWIGRTIVSQYGIVCEVLDAQGDMLDCRAFHNGRMWCWCNDTVSLVTREGEILDWKTGEIFGKVDGRNYDLYEDDKCRKITQEEVEKEF